jgi:hypothetical protein
MQNLTKKQQAWQNSFLNFSMKIKYVCFVFFGNNICNIYCKECMNYEPSAPRVKCFFSKEPWSQQSRQSFRSRRNHWKTVVNEHTRPKQCWINFSGQNIAWKHDPTLPAKGRIYGVEGVATVNRSCPSAKTTALKSGMTLTTWVVQYRHTFLKFPTNFWDLFQSSTWHRA